MEEQSPTLSPSVATTDESQSRFLKDQDQILNIEISEVIFSKLLQIQFDMTSFDLPVKEVRTIV